MTHQLPENFTSLPREERRRILDELKARLDELLAQQERERFQALTQPTIYLN